MTCSGPLEVCSDGGSSSLILQDQPGALLTWKGSRSLLFPVVRRPAQHGGFRTAERANAADVEGRTSVSFHIACFTCFCRRKLVSALSFITVAVREIP